MIEAFIIGFVGSLHCLGMCGPIALAIPFAQQPLKRLAGIFVYNAGRVLTYSFLGAIFGLFGLGLALAGVQQWVSILLGSIMIVSILFPVVFKRIRFLDALFSPVSGYVKRNLSKHLGGKKLVNMFPAGIINGLLPCGLVYVAVAKSVASGSILSGSIFMALFGLGTMPMMVLLPIIGSLSGFKFRFFYRKALPVFVVTLGILFILRGMNLNIKYVSPKLENGNQMEHSLCH